MSDQRKDEFREWLEREIEETDQAIDERGEVGEALEPVYYTLLYVLENYDALSLRHRG